MPASSGGDDTTGTDALSELLSWGEAEPAAGNEAPESSVPAEASDPNGNDGDIAVLEAETQARDEIGYETSYGVPGYGDPGSESERTGGLDHGHNPYVQEGYGPIGYGQTAWPPPGGAQPPWPGQWTYQPKPKVPKRPPRSTPGWFGVALVAAIIGAVVGGGVVSLFTSRSPQTIVKEYFPSKDQKVQVGDVQSILASVLPAVVSIDTSSFRGVGAVGSYVQGAGTGMIIKSSGVILTNNHVIEGAQTVTVTLYGQVKQFPAKIIGTDAVKDIALVQVEGAGHSLPTVSFGNSNAAQQGDGVLAIGNALALAGGPTVTEGIVSALNRSLIATTDNGTSENLTGLIQTDAPINPGNSGGPLVQFVRTGRRDEHGRRDELARQCACAERRLRDRGRRDPCHRGPDPAASG